MSSQKQKNIIIGIVLSLSALISCTFVIYGNIKATEAEENAIEAQTQANLALQERDRADKMQIAAQESAAEARKAMAEATVALERLRDCQSK